ncbi:hypothetical protein MSAN_00753000 [Mycena sanguinolenta]|uniref:Uncharacterized protein n=1 Tax=Mycena sanguinolenta TaxID=230812 RepID=A0A8H6Z216_9AGAR|nr:hypothetical protein MSAN_00753000 [Mycena sanguinolenta]
MDPISLLGLIVALVAFIIAILQAIQQYLATTTLRSKVGRAAIGRWSIHNKRRFSFLEYKFRDEYLEPTFTWDAVCKRLDSQLAEGAKVVSSLKGRYHAAVSSAVAVGPQGGRFHQVPQLRLIRWGDESQTEVPLSALSRLDRKRVQALNRTMAIREEARRTTSAASWVNMMATLVGDPSDFANTASSRLEFEEFMADLDLTQGAHGPSSEGDVVQSASMAQTTAKLASLVDAGGPGSRLDVGVTPDNFAEDLSQLEAGLRIPDDGTSGPSSRADVVEVTSIMGKTNKPGVTGADIDGLKRRLVGKLNSLRAEVNARRDPAYRDADTIPSVLDNPTMDIHLSDLVACGVALDAEIRRIDLRRPVIHMTGKYCSITSQEESGVGMIVRYSAKPGHVHAIQGSTASETAMIVRLAKGYLRIGDAQAHMTDWGYNSVDKLFEIAMQKSRGDDWEQISVKAEFTSRCEGDQDAQWDGHWSHPKTPLVGFLMTHCGNPAVANSFPHTFFRDWPDEDRTVIGQRAYQHIDQEIGFLDTPNNFLVELHSKGVFMTDFKLANNWGAEHAGVRGWSMAPGTEFVKRVSECWSVAEQMRQVAILPVLRSLLEQGRFSLDWAKTYNSRIAIKDEKEGRVKAGTLCWIQIMMLDTWIARQVDLLMLNDSDEAAIPVDFKTAKDRAKPFDKSDKGKTTGWKRARSRFIRLYLARLADGIVIDSESEGSRSVGVSCMSPGGGIGVAGWEGMETGSAKDWMDLDALLSLRAVLLATRMELMYNTDVFLELQEFDPMIRMA